MTLQQLKYVVAVDKYRSFAKAADACHITQPTLSAMLMKLENELSVRIFERTNKSVVPTSAGMKIVRQAAKALKEADKITNLIDKEKGRVAGELTLSIAPTIAPYLLPDFIKRYTAEYPEVQLAIKDSKISNILNALLDGSVDAGIGISGQKREGITEIPLYREPLLVYSTNKLGDTEENQPHFMFVMREALSLREFSFSFSRHETKDSHIYEANSIESLIKMVDAIGGYTIIPQMHIKYLDAKQRENVIGMDDDSGRASRQISLYMKNDYIREQMFNSIAHVLKEIIPEAMIDVDFKKTY